VRRLRTALDACGITTAREGDSHIIPIVVGEAAKTVALGAALAERGFLVGAVRPPTVPEGTSRLRVTIGSEHTAEQIDEFATVLAEKMSELI
jgi:8-amino-7-oxononanoate synthase